MDPEFRTQVEEAAQPQVNGTKPFLPAVAEELDYESRAMASWDRGAAALRSNMDLTTAEGEKLAVKALGNADLQTRNVVGQELPVVGYLAHVAELTSAEGEVTRKTRVVMLLEDGKTVSTMSAGCMRVLRYLAASRGPGRWKKPARVIVHSHPLGEGRSYCTMELVGESGETEGKRKAK